MGEAGQKRQCFLLDIEKLFKTTQKRNILKAGIMDEPCFSLALTYSHKWGTGGSPDAVKFFNFNFIYDQGPIVSGTIHSR